MIYLDNAATSFPKPPRVLAAVQHWFEAQGTSAERGDSTLSATVRTKVDGVRHRLAALFSVPDHRLVFTAGATDSLNVFLDGFLRDGDAVLTTALEHSSLARPLVHLREPRNLTIEILAPDPHGVIHPEQFAAALRQRDYRLVAFSHASNVIGSVLDAAAICRLARGHDCVTLLDASQTAGLLDLDVGADAVVSSAHKHLLGPPGLGILAVREGVALRLTRFGGTGSSRALATQPETWPTAMEPGTPNTPAILGLGAALDYLDEHDRGDILAHELHLSDLLRAELGPRATFFGPTDGPRIPVTSFRIPDLDPAEAGMILDAAGIHVRTGFHCAPWLHEHLGTSAGGTVRVSPGPFNPESDIRAVPRALPCA